MRGVARTGTTGTFETTTAPGRAKRRPAGWRVLAVLALAAAALSLTAPTGKASAQETLGSRPPSIALLGGGMTRFDFRGDGTTGAFAGRARFPLVRWLVLEPSVLFTSFEAEGISEGAESEVTLGALDFQLQLQRPSGRLRPYVGAGLGGAVDFRRDRDGADFVVSTFTAGGGLEAGLFGRFSLLADVRFRWFDGFTEDALDYTLGLSLEL